MKKPWICAACRSTKQRAVRAGGGQQIGNQLRADRHARPVLAILPGIAVIRNHHRDARRRGALQRVDHDQQFHQVLVHRIAGGLHHEHVHAANVLEQLEIDFAVGEALQLGLAHRHADVTCRSPRPAAGWPSAEDLEALVLAQLPRLRLRSGAGLPTELSVFGRPVRRPRSCLLLVARLLPVLLLLITSLLSLQAGLLLIDPTAHGSKTSKLVGFSCIRGCTAHVVHRLHRQQSWLGD